MVKQKIKIVTIYNVLIPFSDDKWGRAPAEKPKKSTEEKILDGVNQILNKMGLTLISDQENQDEESYKNGWYFLYYVKITMFL